MSPFTQIPGKLTRIDPDGAKKYFLKAIKDGDTSKVAELESKIVKHLGISSSINAVGQVYPRALDYEVLSALYTLTSGPSSFAKTLRIMAGNETASEGFAKGQVGSSAMPQTIA